jgi:hypothetical protein
MFLCNWKLLWYSHVGTLSAIFLKPRLIYWAIEELSRTPFKVPLCKVLEPLLNKTVLALKDLTTEDWKYCIMWQSNKWFDKSRHKIT